MQIELILILTLAWFSTCEKCRQGTTVLTDEYKKVMDQFDFSGFDKQEALNYIDRHRYENQIRGKRSGLNLIDGKVARCNDEDEIYRDVHNNLILPPSLKNFPRRRKLTLIKDLVARLKRKIDDVQIYMKNSKANEMNQKRLKRGQNKIKKKKKYKKKTDDDDEEENNKRKKRKKKRYWDNWGEWSPCSVTCGKGRRIRWRRCIVKDCYTGELEMGEKTCQLPACNILSKFLDILN